MAAAGGRMTDCHARPLTYLKDDPTQRHGMLVTTTDRFDVVAPRVAAAYASWLSESDPGNAP